mgnify:CR=1 FL=1
MIKTNAMRLLDAAKIPYVSVEYEYDEKDLSGLHAAAFLQIPPEQFFKTLVLRSSKKGYFVCCIPVNKELDLKKAAAALGDKSAEMIHVKELPSVTGYIRGGCSPIGMKKRFPTFFDASINQKETVYISAGTRGCALCINSMALLTYLGAQTVPL